MSAAGKSVLIILLGRNELLSFKFHGCEKGLSGEVIRVLAVFIFLNGHLIELSLKNDLKAFKSLLYLMIFPLFSTMFVEIFESLKKI